MNFWAKKERAKHRAWQNNLSLLHNSDWCFLFPHILILCLRCLPGARGRTGVRGQRRPSASPPTLTAVWRLSLIRTALLCQHIVSLWVPASFHQSQPLSVHSGCLWVITVSSLVEARKYKSARESCESWRENGISINLFRCKHLNYETRDNAGVVFVAMSNSVFISSLLTKRLIKFPESLIPPCFYSCQVKRGVRYSRSRGTLSPENSLTFWEEHLNWFKC